MRFAFKGWVVGLAVALLALVEGATGQNFAQPKVIATGNWPAAVYAADVNGDGIPDLIYIDQGATVTASTTHVLLGDGKGNFTHSATIATAGASVAIGDLTGDGIVDIGWLTWTGATAGLNTFLNIAGGTGTGTFRATQTTSFGLSLGGAGSQQKFTSLLAAPIRGPGHPLDLLAVGNASTWFDIQPPGPNGYAAGQNPLVFNVLLQGVSSLAVADLTNSGQDDLVVRTGDNASVIVVSHTLLTSHAVFPTGSKFTPGTGVHSLLLKDVNGDARPDLIAEGAEGQVDVYFGNGDGTFQSTSSGGTGTLDGTTGNGGHLIAIADLNHDGNLDALTATPAGISTLLGQSTGYFGLKGIYNAGPGDTSYAVADFNGDGNLDLAVDSPEGIAILFGNADGSFQTSQAFAAGQPAMSGALGAFTASSNLDAVVSTAATQAQFLHGNGDGTFTYAGSPGAATPTTTQTGPAGLWSVVQTGDFNGDGKVDLALTSDASVANLPTSGSGVSVQTGNGDGTFSAPVHTPVNEASGCGNPGYILYGRSAYADFNLDGITDLAGRDVYEEFIHLGRSNNSYPLYEQEVIGDGNCVAHSHNWIVAGDFNNDGLPDLILQTDGHLNLELSQGAAAFTQQEPLGGFALDTTKDLSVDGSLTTPGQLTAPALNSTFNGPAIPTSSGGLGFPAFIGSMAGADLDKDGNNDLIVAYANLSANLQAPVGAAPNYIYIWYGSGNGKFLTSVKHPVNPVVLTPSRNFYQVAVADMNGDGIPDLILSDGYILSVQLGKGDGTFGAETHSLAGQGINTISVGDVNGDGKPDLVLANGGAVLTNPVANLETLATNPDVNTGGVTVLLNHASAAPALQTVTGSVTATPEPSQYGSAFTLTATLTPATGPTGTVSFSIDGSAIGSANLTGGSAVVTVPAFVYNTLAIGAHTITAVYSGDSTYAPATFNGTHTVSLIPTSMSLLLCVDPPGSNFPCGNPIESTPPISPITMYYGQSLNGVAIESATNLTGSIIFYSGSSIFCTLNANLSQGSNTCPPNSGIFPAGTTIATAAYTGDSTHSGSTSNAITVTVYADTTEAALTSSLNPSTFGQNVAFTADVQGNYAPGAGTVIFLDGTTTLGTATLDATGHAVFNISSLAMGTHPIRVAFPGSANFNSITSATLNQVVNAQLAAVQSAVSLVSSVNPSAPSQPVTFTATVSVPGPFAIIPAGTVTFFDGTTTLGTATLNAAGVATYTTSTLTTGSHNITAAYGGEAGGSGIGPVQPPLPPKPPSAFVPAGGFHVSGPGVRTALPYVTSPTQPAPQVLKPQPLAMTATPAILASTSPILVQVVTSALSAAPSGFTLTVSPVPVTLGVGRTAILLVTVLETSGFNQPVQLTCSGLPVEATCTFLQPTIPAGGGSTTLYLATAAPHACGTTTPYFLGSLRRAIPAAALALLLMLPGLRRRRLPRTLLLLLASFCGLAALSGCGNCTDLGTRPGTYTFTATGTAQSTTHSQTIQLTTTIP